MPSLSDKTEIGLPLKNLIGLLGVTITAAWAYFGVIERLNNIETRATLFEADLLKAADQKPIDQEQFLIQESLSADLEKLITRVDEMMHNGVNIQRMMKDIDRLRDDVEMLKDKVRKNGSSYSSVNVSE